MVTGVILAAGQARRMGQPKQLLCLGDKAMVWHVVATACQADLDEVIVITGAYQEEVTQVLQQLPVRIIHNEDWLKGQSTSVKKTIQVVTAEAVVFLLADQPLITVALINDVVKGYHETKASIVMPRWQNRPGNPVLFDLEIWRSVLLQLSGDEGARQIIRHNQGMIHYIELLNEQIFFDVDTPEEYQKMQQIWKYRK